MSRLISGKAAVSVLVAIFVMVCLTSSALVQVPADAMLAMHFDEGSGAIVKDESGYGNDGTIHGATWTSGISGKALSFDGADDYVEIPHKNSLDSSNEITIGVWIRIASATSGIILEKDVIGTGLNDWTLGIGEGKPYFIVGVNYKNYNLKSPISVDDNNWHYIAVRRDFNGLLQLDVDGVEVASENFPKGSISNSESIHIGCWDTPRGIESFFEGTVDELYIYNQALSDEEIEALYKGLITPTPTPRQTPIPMPSTVDFAQHSAAVSGDFVILTNDGRVYEIDPRHLSDIQLRTAAGPVNVAAVIPDLYDDSILAFTGDGKLYQCKDSENWANWNKVGDINLPSGSKIVDFAQHSAADSGDFVILTNDGRVYEVDPRHLSDIQLRTAATPVNVAAVIPDRYDNSILAVTSDGVLYRATTDDDWNTWEQVGRVQLSGGSKIVGFAQHSAVTTGDFVFLTGDGKVYEVDPRRLSIFEFRTANGPSNVVAMKPNTYDNSILAVTDSGVLYRATTDDNWNTWTQVGNMVEYPPTPTPIVPTPPLPKESPLISVEKVASGSDVAYLELIYNPRLQNYYGYEVHLSNPNLEVSVPEYYSITYIAPIKVKGKDITGELFVWAGAALIDSVLFRGLPVASFAAKAAEIFKESDVEVNINKAEFKDFLLPEIIPCSYTESFISGNKDIFIVQIISKVPTKDWKISYQATVDYKYLSDPSYEGTRKEPPKLSGTFLQSGKITINKEGVDHEWDFKNGNELVSKEQLPQGEKPVVPTGEEKGIA